MMGEVGELPATQEKWWNSRWIILSSWAFGLVGVLGVALTIIFFFSGERVRDPHYALWTNNLIKDFKGKIDKLDITYSSVHISDLSVTKLAFWNNGKETIDGSDIAPQDPVLIKTKGDCRILDTPKLIYASTPANAFRVTPGAGGYLIKFDYVDYSQGGIVEFFTTCVSSEEIEVTGSIRGTAKLARTDLDAAVTGGESPTELSRSREYLANVLSTAAVVFYIVGMVLALFFVYFRIITLPRMQYITTAIMGASLILLATGIYETHLAVAIQAAVPQSFKAFYTGP
jgi:hypothetical protein